MPPRLFGSIQEEAVQDAESVRRQQQAHGQQHSCTLDECFQLYTKEEQVRALPTPCPPLARGLLVPEVLGVPVEMAGGDRE